MPPPVPVLLYHRVCDDPGREISPFTVAPHVFVRHLDLVVEGGHTALTVTGFADVLAGRRQLPPRPVVLTFDDGFADTLDVATPSLRERGLPATVYVTTGQLPGCPSPASQRALGPMFSWSRLAELEAAGLEVGAHSHSHPQLDIINRESARLEARRSQELLADALGHPVFSFAYPHGYSTAWLRKEVERLGFESACGVGDVLSGENDHRFNICRLTVRADTTHARFSDWLRGTGAGLAPRQERLRTKAWRQFRRMQEIRRPSGGHDDL